MRFYEISYLKSSDKCHKATNKHKKPQPLHSGLLSAATVELHRVTLDHQMFHLCGWMNNGPVIRAVEQGVTIPNWIALD